MSEHEWEIVSTSSEWFNVKYAIKHISCYEQREKARIALRYRTWTESVCRGCRKEIPDLYLKFRNMLNFMDKL